MTHSLNNQSISHHDLIAHDVCKLGFLNQSLINRSLELGLFQDAIELSQLDKHISWLLEYKSSEFNFVAQVRKGKTLLVGEGNLSFTRSLVKKPEIIVSNLTATIFGSADLLSLDGQNNKDYLKAIGVKVLDNIDATNLTKTFGNEKFETIIFQFPNAGSREPIEGRNPNFILIRDFLKSAALIINFDGAVLVSVVDSPYYEGAFSFIEAAELAGFKSYKAYKFNPSNYSGYEHTMTHQDGNALENYNSFCTWVFKLIE